MMVTSTEKALHSKAFQQEYIHYRTHTHRTATPKHFFFFCRTFLFNRIKDTRTIADSTAYVTWVCNSLVMLLTYFGKTTASQEKFLNRPENPHPTLLTLYFNKNRGSFQFSMVTVQKKSPPGNLKFNYFGIIHS